MMLAFLIDQIQQRCCRLFQAAVTAAKSNKVDPENRTVI
jgi:hypothetical protein